MQHLKIDGIVVAHRINPRMKHTYLQVLDDGTVLLKSNGRHPEALRKFVLSKRMWIERQMLRIKERPSIELGANLLYKGVMISAESAGLNVATIRTETALRKRYDSFYRDRASEYLTERTQFFAQMMGVEYRAVKLRKMRRRWGSCSRMGDITYNTLLMQLPPAMIDYTVVHELAHLVHFNHSRAFHAFVAKFIPEEMALRRRMRDIKAVLY